MEKNLQATPENEKEATKNEVDQEKRTLLKTIAYAAPITLMLLTAENATPQSNGPQP